MIEFQLPPSADQELLSPHQRVIEYGELSVLMATDSDGVPLNGDRDPYDQRPNAFWQYRGNPYPMSPSREATTLPVSDMERTRLREHLPLMYEMVRQLRTAYCQVVDLPENQPLNLNAANDLAGVLSEIPTYLLYRSQDRVGRKGKMPATISLLSHAGQGTRAGLGSAANRHLGKENSAFSATTPDKIAALHTTGSEVLEVVETVGNLIGSLGGSKTICAAGPHMIVRFIDAILRGHIPAHREADQLQAEASKLLSDLKLSEQMSRLLFFSLAINHCNGIIMQFQAKPRYEPFSNQELIRIGEFSDMEQQMNDALGRVGTLPDLTLDEWGRKYHIPAAVVRL